MNNIDKISLLKKNRAINILAEFNRSNIFCELKDNNTRFVGGCIIDILEGRKPKDYDILGYIGTFDFLVDNGFKFKYDTRYSTTFQKEDYIFQFLKTDINNFDFKISQTSFHPNCNYLSLDNISFVNKKLIPVSYEKENIINSLYRIPHWKRKGYDIDDVTYLSMISILNKEINKDS